MNLSVNSAGNDDAEIIDYKVNETTLRSFSRLVHCEHLIVGGKLMLLVDEDTYKSVLQMNYSILSQILETSGMTIYLDFGENRVRLDINKLNVLTK